MDRIFSGNDYYWKSISPSKVPDAAFRGGTDADGSPIYVGRIKHARDLLPGSVFPKKKIANASYAGREHIKEKCEILCTKRVCFKWIPSWGGHPVPNMVPGGKTVDGETLYIGRVYHKATHTVGKIHPSHNVCYIPFDGKEIMYQNYEILTVLPEVKGSR